MTKMLEARPKSMSLTTNTLRGSTFVSFELDIEKYDDFKPLEGTLEGFTLTLKKSRPKSLSANAYMWQLCGKIATEIKATKEDVYRHAIRATGKWTDVVLEGDVELFISSWETNGEGWFCEVITRFPTATEIRAYIGSSVYSGEELSLLIDWVVEEAKELNIETITPAEISQMMNAWSGK